MFLIKVYFIQFIDLSLFIESVLYYTFKRGDLHRHGVSTCALGTEAVEPFERRLRRPRVKHHPER